MAVGDGGKIGIDVEIKLDKLQADLNKAESKLKQSAKKMEKGAKVNIGVADGLAKAFAIMGSVEAGLKGITAVTKLMRGDLEGFDATMRSLPFGIGPVFGALTDVALAVTGIADQVTKIRGELGDWLTAEKKLQASNAIRWAGEDAANKRAATMGELIREQVRAGQEMTEEAREQFTLNESILKLKQQARDIREAGGDSRELERDIEQLEKAGNEAIDRARGKRADDAAERAAAVERAKEAKAKAAAAELFALETKLQQARLINEGKILEARMLGIQRARDAEIRAARDAGNEAKALLLERLRDAELDAARKAGAKAANTSVVDDGPISAGQFRAVETGRFGFNNVATAGSKVQKVQLVGVDDASLRGLNLTDKLGGGGAFGFAGGG